MDFDDILLEAQDAMDKAVQHAVHEFNTIHTGKATPSMVDGVHVHVEAYGTSMPVRDLGAVTTPDSRSIQITPWDKSVAPAIEKAIRMANLGLNPMSRGTVIYVPVPELSGERRKELVKVSAGHAEDGRIAVRKARQNAMEGLKTLKAEGHTSEDDIKRFEAEIQKETDAHVEKINEALKAKEAELLQV
ncbi:MAG: ribosome recycling factor [Opitutales bacterium]